MSTTVTHLAGPLIRFGTHQRQRCSWCGYVLIDDDLTRVNAPIEPCSYCGTSWTDESADETCQRTEDGPHRFQPPKPPSGWPFEALVEVTTDGGFRASATVEPHLHADGTCIPPDNACMRVPPELTLAVEARS